MIEKKILDMTCGFRTIWFNKHHPAAVYCDKRREDMTLYFGKARTSPRTCAEAINRLNENWRRTNTGSIAEACYSAAIDSIHLIPAADVVEVRHGRWIKDG